MPHNLGNYAILPTEKELDNYRRLNTQITAREKEGNNKLEIMMFML